MLDTKLKKSHKKTNLIIALIVLIPALILVSLYPTMERAMKEKKAEELEWWTEQKEALEKKEGEAEASAETSVEVLGSYQLRSDFANYVVEASYYQYAQLLQEKQQKEVDISVLEYYGWINDYYDLISRTPYYVEYGRASEETAEEAVDEAVNGAAEAHQGILSEQSYDLELDDEAIQRIMNGQEIPSEMKDRMKEQGYLGYFYIEYDSYGKITEIRIAEEENLECDPSLYRIAKNSIRQYQENVAYYDQELQEPDTDLMAVCPKDFRGIYLLYEDNFEFLYLYDGYNIYDEDVIYHDGSYYPVSYFEGEMIYNPAENYYMEIGAYWVMLALALFVFAAAMILPFFKRLETGREKLFCIPTEVMCCVAAAGLFLAMGMGMLMSYTTMEQLETLAASGTKFRLLGYSFSLDDCYRMLLAVNFFGWALTFFMEYICAAQIRQFFCGPKEYLKNRILIIRFFRWIGRKCRDFWHYVTDIDIEEGLHKSILKIVLVNFAAVVLLCCMWFVGIAGAVVYAVLLYVLLKKYGEKLQKQYRSILNATGQMAEGELCITLEEELGVFEPLGQELAKVQKGFAKAVAEEAKSQNMKSELITNVSHDLKTPLTAIITYVDLLKKPDLTEEERASYIETLDQKSQRLKVLIEDLFEVSKANSGNVTMHFMDVDIVNLMKEVRVELDDRIRESTLDFRWKLPEEKILVSLDGQRTYRIFENLINNAIKYAMPYTRVYVGMCEEGSEVIITFRNMSAQELNMDADYLTERFVRGDSARQSEGSGLGLAIAKSFTELQHGSFEIKVDGDLFKVTLTFPKN